MIQIDEQKLRQLFKNRSNCYADAEYVVQAMDEDCFIETVNEALRLFAVSGSSAVNRCNECSKELESGTVFCSADCRQHYYH